jgi:hypothetical protein
MLQVLSAIWRNLVPQNGNRERKVVVFNCGNHFPSGL